MKTLSLLLIVLQAFPLHAASLQVGIMPVGKLQEEEQRAYPILEKRLERWLENQTVMSGISAKPISQTVGTADFSLGIAQVQLKKINAEVKKGLMSSGAPNKALLTKVEELSKLRRSLENHPESAPQVQEALFWESLSLWKTGKKKESVRDLSLAIKVHPEGRINRFFTEENAGSDFQGFEKEAGKISKTLSRDCKLVLLKDKQDSIFVNGFNLGSKKELHLISGNIYHLTKGEGYQESLVRCERQSTRKVAISDVRARTEKSKRFLVKEGIDTFLFVKSGKKGFELQFYTPEIAADTLSLENSVTARGLIEAPDKETLPISQTEFKEITQRHHWERLSMHSLLPVGHPNPHSPLTSQLDAKIEERSAWYNSWVFWAIAGTVAAGATIAIVSTRNSNSVGSSKTH